MLHEYEWFQSWRYTWPLIGGLFVADSYLFYFSEQPCNNNLLGSHQPGWIRCINATAGLGLIIGGAYDAFMPVWMTGPNVLTAAGIGQDSAALLFVTALGAAVYDGDAQSSPAKLLSYIVLLSQLYILGDAAFQDLLSGTVFSQP